MLGFSVRQAIVGFALFVTGAVVALAQEAGAIPQVRVEIRADGFTVPDKLPEGAVEITFENSTEAPAAPIISRLNEGVTAASLGAAFSSEDPFAAMSLATDLGGMMVAPGMTLSVTYALVPGKYVISNLFEGEQLFPFTVEDGEGVGAAPPEATLNIDLLDFAFNVPISLPAGANTLHLENTGDQFHMMLVFRLDQSLTVHQINQLLQDESETLPEGVEEVTTWFPMSEGEQAWVTLDLEPGTYLLLCPLPDVTGSGHSHHQLGMRQFIEVTEPA